MKTGTKNPILLILLAALLAFLSVGGAGARAASQADPLSASPKAGQPAPAAVPPGPKVFDLCASDGTITMPDSTVITVWGFIETATCTPGLITSLPGPELRAVAGDSVTINLDNALSVSTSMLIPGQTLSSSGGTPGAFTAEAPAGGSVTYTFIASTGTYLYESGTDANRQVSMGLYGALVVETGVAGEAYGPASAFDVEATLVLSSLDPSLNSDPYGFDMLDYKPTYWLLGGEAYPDTNVIPVLAGDSLLLRYLNASFHNLSMSLLGEHQHIIAKDAYLVPNPISAVAETVPAGQTMDAIINIPAGQPVGSHLAVFNRNMYVTNGNTYPGGMLALIEVGAPGPVYGVLLSPDSDSGSGSPGSTVSYMLDITNDGNTTDTFDITVSGNAWNTIAPLTVGPLSAGITTQIQVDVEIPAGAANGSSDTATVTATSQGDNGQFASSELTTTATVTNLLYFSTVNGGPASSVPGVTGPYDDADIYAWAGGASYSRVFDGSVAGLPANADIDGLQVVDADTFYMSFNVNTGTSVPTLGTVQDEDIVFYDAGVWSLYFDGSAVGLDTNNEDVDAFAILPDNSLVISTLGGVNPIPDLAGTQQDEDLLRCVPTSSSPISSCTWSFYFDGSDVGLATSADEDIDGLAIDGSTIYVSTLGNFDVTALTGEGRDVFSCDSATTGAASACGGFSMYFDGSANSLSNNLLDALDIP